MYNESATPAKPIINSTLSIINYSELEELKVGDLACGSGHILNECFDLLYDLYIAEGYGRGEAIENIFRHNLTGVDLDTRAKQLATFALLLKACQKDNAFADAHCLPNVLDMEHLIPYNYDNLRDTLPHFFLGGSGEAITETLEAYRLMEEANTLGSIMKFDISESTRSLIAESMNRWQEKGYDNFEGLFSGMKLILALTEKYHALVMNPPYMGGGNMNATLSKYVKDEYEEGKADLFSVFMLLAINRLLPNGKYGMINMQSWMFLSSFEKLRTRLLIENRIDNMLHLGPRTFDELSGEVVQNTAFVITNCEGKDATGSYYRLIEGKNCGDKECMFLEAQENSGKAIVNSKLYIVNYNNVSQQDFEKIPGCPIGYWVSENAICVISKSLSIADVASPKQGLATGDNNRFLRNIWEISKDKRGLNKWVPCTKGGGFRKWYGNIEYCVNWENDGYEIKHYFGPNGKLASRPQNLTYYFKQNGCTWSTISSGKPAFRKFEADWLFETKGSVCFPKEEADNNKFLAYFNSPLVNYYLRIFSPTMDYHEGPIGKLPYLYIKDENLERIVDCLTSQNISISKQDWDAHETSWDFETNPLLAVDTDTYIDNIHHEIERHEKETGERICIDPAAPELDSLEWRMEQYKQKWEHLFMQLHENEEELNRQFIEIYGLGDELTPDVPLNEITILQQGEISFNV